ncbi:hypothetical protein ACVWYQ_005444 [Bradyrhizobium sp. USDA 3397]
MDSGFDAAHRPGMTLRRFSLNLVAASWPFVELLARPRETARKSAHSPVTKSKKTFPQPFPKAARLDTYPPHPDGHCPGVAFQGSLWDGSEKPARPAPAATDRPQDLTEGAQRFNAGWSSPVARQAHNLKVIGSNPIPATKFGLTGSETKMARDKRAIFVFGGKDRGPSQSRDEAAASANPLESVSNTARL